MSAISPSTAKSASKTTLWSAVVTRNLPTTALSATAPSATVPSASAPSAPSVATTAPLVGPAASTSEGAKLVYTEDFMGVLMFTNGLKVGTSHVPQQVDVPLEVIDLARENIVQYYIPGSEDFEPGGICRFWRKPNVTRATYTFNGETYVIDYTQFPPYPPRELVYVDSVGGSLVLVDRKGSEKVCVSYAVVKDIVRRYAADGTAMYYRKSGVVRKPYRIGGYRYLVDFTRLPLAS